MKQTHSCAYRLHGFDTILLCFIDFNGIAVGGAFLKYSMFFLSVLTLHRSLCDAYFWLHTVFKYFFPNWRLILFTVTKDIDNYVEYLIKLYNLPRKKIVRFTQQDVNVVVLWDEVDLYHLLYVWLKHAPNSIKRMMHAYPTQNTSAYSPLCFIRLGHRWSAYLVW